MKLFTRETVHLSFVMELLILVIGITIFTMVDPVQSCHRKVEYHHFYKKQPQKGWGWGWKEGQYQGHGGHGHGQSHGHKGYGKGWQSEGHGHDKGYGHMQHKGHQGHGHYGKGHGHMEQKGYGHQEHGGQYGKGHQKGYGGHQKGYGGHQEEGHGHGKGYEPEGYGGHKGGDEYGHHQDGGYQSGYQMPQHKGMKYKHSSYEMSTYGDKGSHGHGMQHNHKGGHDHANHKGYGYSGPYPNTEYSNNVVTSLNPAPYESSASPGAADTAEYIRSLTNSNSNRNAHYISAPILADTVPLSSSISNLASKSDSEESPTNREADLASGNFDLNLEFNSDLPGPFRSRSGTSNGRRGILRKQRKKISSTFKAVSDPLESRSNSESDDLTNP